MTATVLWYGTTVFARAVQLVSERGAKEPPDFIPPPSPMVLARFATAFARTTFLEFDGGFCFSRWRDRMQACAEAHASMRLASGEKNEATERKEAKINKKLERDLGRSTWSLAHR